MQTTTDNIKEKNEVQAVCVDRPRLKLSEMNVDKIADLSNMFGLWKEADHCDKD